MWENTELRYNTEARHTKISRSHNVFTTQYIVRAYESSLNIFICLGTTALESRRDNDRKEWTVLIHLQFH